MAARPAFFPARFISQHLWWDLTWPLFKTAAFPAALARLAIHLGSVVVIYRLAGLFRMARWPAFLAALMFGVSPFAFTPVFWASGIQELLGAFFALLGIAWWFRSHSRASLALATLFILLSIFAKEAALGLPLVFLVIVLAGYRRSGPDRNFRLLCIAVMVGGSVLEAGKIMGHFDTGPQAAYAVGGLTTMVQNLGIFGWWALSSVHHFTAGASLLMWSVGMAFLLGWAGLGIFRARQGVVLRSGRPAGLPGQHRPGPAAGGQIHPYLGYLGFAALSLALFHEIGQLRIPPSALVLLGLIFLAWGFRSDHARLNREGANGRPADPVVAATHLSRQASREVLAIRDHFPRGKPASLVVYQPPLNDADVQRSLVTDRPLESPRYRALEGELGLRVLLGKNAEVRWTNTLLKAGPDAWILCETGQGLLYWGDLWTGLLNSAALNLSLGHFDLTRRNLARAWSLSPDFSGYRLDPGSCPVSPERLAGNIPRFSLWLRSLQEEGMITEKDREVIQGVFREFRSRLAATE